MASWSLRNLCIFPCTFSGTKFSVAHSRNSCSVKDVHARSVYICKFKCLFARSHKKLKNRNTATKEERKQRKHIFPLPGFKPEKKRVLAWFKNDPLSFWSPPPPSCSFLRGGQKPPDMWSVATGGLDTKLLLLRIVHPGSKDPRRTQAWERGGEEHPPHGYAFYFLKKNKRWKSFSATPMSEP